MKMRATRRKFLDWGRAGIMLLTAGFLLPPSLTTSTSAGPYDVSLPPDDWKPGDPIGYIRPEVPIEIPPYLGERYEAWVPDTLDLAERAELAINGLTGPTDPKADYEVYWQANFFRDPPMMFHDVDDVQPKFMEALPLLRIITGSDHNNHVDEAWMQSLLRCIGPDGAIYMPLKGRPWAKLYVGPDGYPHPVWREDGQTTTIHDPSVTQVTMDWIAFARLMAAMMVYHLRDQDPMWKGMVEKIVDRLWELAIKKGDFCYFPLGSFEPDARVSGDPKMPQGMQVGEGAARLIQGLAHCYRVTRYPPAAELARQLVVYLKDHGGFFDKDGKFINQGEDFIHFHAHAIDLLGILEYAIAVGDRDLMEFVRKGYEYGRANGSSTVGFFPEIIEELPTRNPYPKAHRGCLVSETCEVADMIALALKLTTAGVGDYWDDVDRWVRNQFIENQLTRVDWVERIPKPQKPTRVSFHQTTERVAERNLGAFAGWPSANDWTIYAGIQHCCTGNAARAIYYVWENILHWQEGQLRVNLLLNRASPWADVNSHIPYEGKVEVHIKEKCERVLIRIPEWIEPGSGMVTCKINGQDRDFAWKDRYVEVGSAESEDTVTLTFPIQERTVNEMIGLVLYTLVIKGNDVVFIDPPGKNHPLYQRAHYRENQTRWRKIKRFVSRERITW
jgi:hypothetical protein